MNGLRDKLSSVQDQLRAVRAAIPAAEKEMQAARDAFGRKEDLQADVKITETKEFLEAKEARAKLGELLDQKNDLEAQEQEFVSVMGDQVANGNGYRTGSLDRPKRPAIHGWDARTMLAESEAYADAKRSGVFTSDAKFGTIVLGQVADRETAMQFIQHGGAMRADIPAATPGPYSTPALGIQPDFRGIIPYRVRPLTLLDLIPTGTTDSNSIEYVQVSGIPQAAVETAELAAKPQGGFQTQDATAPVRTIAVWIKMSRQSMDDQAGVVSIINSLLPYDVRRRIEAQVLSGDGVGQNLRGILNTSGIASPASVAGDNVADCILRGVTLIELSDRIPDFAVLHPTAWQNLLLLRTNVGGANTGEYLYGAPGTLASPTLWGLTITPSRIVGVKAPLVGDSSGCQILVREGINVKTSDADQDDFIKNRVTLLAETRLAFPVWYPTAFCLCAQP